MSIIEHFGDFFGATGDFSGKNRALRWSILMEKQNHNV